MHPIAAISKASSKRTNFLSVGVTLCVLISLICVTPLVFVQNWIAIWLLMILSVLILGTFGIWAYHAVKNPRLLDTEHHQEQMAAIAILGINSDGSEPKTIALGGERPTTNPLLNIEAGEGS